MPADRWPHGPFLLGLLEAQFHQARDTARVIMEREDGRAGVLAWILYDALELAADALNKLRSHYKEDSPRSGV